ncbi:MAG: hypothetical protein H0V09_11780 [Gemmatimonadetes bacterium]|nr:hypothetical protein [Gemmatimonadota bacterium]
MMRTDWNPEAEDAAGGAWARRRLKLVSVGRSRDGEFRCRARVVLEDPGHGPFEGEAELPFSEQNYHRVAAQATLQALRRAGGETLPLRLVGLRLLRIFDTPLVAVQVGLPTEGGERLLLGIAVATDDPGTGAARAVLHATNRIVGNVIDT